MRLDTERGEHIVTVRPAAAQPVKLDEREFYQALARLGRQVHPPANPQEAARRLFELGERSGWFQYDLRSQRIVPLGKGEHLEEVQSASTVELTRGYLKWCESQGTPGDCRRLLLESPTIGGDGRYALAMAFANGSVLNEMRDALKGMANPDAVLSAVLWTCTTYLLLLAVPEPVSKGIAAVMTVAVIAWVGLDTFWSLIAGFKQLVEESEHATTIDELRRAGERYGKVMGGNAARAFVLLAAAVVGNTTAGLASKLPTLPGASQAAELAGTQLRVNLSEVSAVTAVAVNANAVTISLAAGAVMTMNGSDGSGGQALRIESPSGEGVSLPDERAGHIFRDAPGHLRDTPANRQLLRDVGSDPKARLGTDKFGNTWSARTNPDGTQTWVETRKGEIMNGGINQTPKVFNPETGLSAPKAPGR